MSELKREDELYLELERQEQLRKLIIFVKILSGSLVFKCLCFFRGVCVRIKRGFLKIIQLFKVRDVFAPAEHQILLDKIFNQKQGARVFILVGFDVDHEIPLYVLNYCQTFKRMGFYVMYVSSSRIANEFFERSVDLSEFVDRIIVRTNIARDFGSYYTGLSLLDLNKLDQIVLANDSVYGPFADMTPMFDDLEFKLADVWGLTDSYQGVYHLQSYFLVFNLNDRLRQFLQLWLMQFLFYKEKNRIIVKYEIGLSQMLLAQHFKLKAQYSYALVSEKMSQLAKSKERFKGAFGMVLSTYVSLFKPQKQYNPTHFFWIVLIYYYQFPFVKRELVAFNPEALPYVDSWARLIHEQFHVPMQMYESHLCRYLL